MDISATGPRNERFFWRRRQKWDWTKECLTAFPPKGFSV
jgi:hypothetical protein